FVRERHFCAPAERAEAALRLAPGEVVHRDRHRAAPGLANYRISLISAAMAPMITIVCTPTVPNIHFKISALSSARRISRYSRLTTVSPIVSESALAMSCACLAGTPAD